ncbi:hypothetical protein PROFUN_14779 [Planoprotostelium fungivorum]|uniref:Uncharacterized protein n=1 Tax=Planoprotostelium fungivorum TaxID=1890364 RepID=A0A2P6MYM3_9EUKA|nr:hypothetical protein PROFUN_14779 [Planoprotostelium fungivorum]
MTVSGCFENPLWQSALMTISWRKQGKRELIDLSEEMFIFNQTHSHSLPNGTPTTDNKYVADNSCWKATGPGDSVSYNYLGERPNGSTSARTLTNVLQRITKQNTGGKHSKQGEL